MRRILTIIFVVVLLGMGMLGTVQNSLPGDFLYTMKISFEDVQINLTSAKGDADLYLRFAAERVAEMNRLLEKGKIVKAEIASQRLANQLEALASLLDNSGSQEQVYALIHITENYSLVVEQLKRSVLTTGESSVWMAAVLEDQVHIQALFLSDSSTLLSMMIEDAGGFRSPEVMNAALPDENDIEQVTVTPPFHISPSPSFTPVTPTQESSVVVTTSTNPPVFQSPAAWFTKTPTDLPSTNPTRSASFTPTLVSTLRSTSTNNPNPMPTNQPSATSPGYPPPPQQTATTAGYPPPPQPTAQPTATSPGYPPPPQQTATTAGYPPPPQPTNPPVPTQKPTATQSGYPPPQSTQQPTSPAYP